MTSSLLDILAAQQEYGPALRRLICELAVAGRLLPRAGEWAEHRLNKIVSVRGGSTPSMARPEYWGGDVPWVSPKDMHAGEIVTSEMFITQEALAKTNLELVPLGSVLIVGRSGILKRKLPAQVTRVPCTVNQDIKALTPTYAIESAYLRLWLLGSEREILAEDVKTGTTVQSLVFPKLFARRVLLPPLSEQHRIVAKVDELMALCDRLEARQQDAEAAHERLVQALLDGLTEARDAEEFQACWQRLEGQLELVLTTTASIDAAKQAVLRLAFSGRLLSRESGASAECQKLLPEGWREVQIAEIAFVGTGATPARTNPAYFDPPEFPWVTSGETSSAVIDSTSQRVSALALAETNLTLYPPGTLIVAMYGQGKTRGQVTELAIEACTNQACAAIRLKNSSTIHRQYVKYFFEKSYDELRELAAGGAQPNLNLGKIKSTLIPLPSLDEQRCIVAKVTELLTLCDRLKARIAAARAKQAQLAEVLVRAAAG